LSTLIASAGLSGTTPPGAGVPVSGHSATGAAVVVVEVEVVAAEEG
jgi:hypothetical protein